MVEEKGRSVEEISRLGISLASSMLKKKIENVVEVSRDAKGWKLIVETLERKAIPDTQDLLSRYEFELDTKGEVLGYKQILLRRRSEFSA